MRIAVIGVGASGASTLRFIVAGGHEAVGYEQFSLGHAMGSSHGTSRLIRRTYPDAFHTRWMEEAYRLWAELESEAGEELFVRCGGLTFAVEGEPTLESTRTSLVEAGIAHRLLSRGEVAEEYPAIDIGVGASAIHQEDSGFLRADRCIAAQIASARAGGAEIREHSVVESIEERQGAVFVSTLEGTDRFDAAIVTAGPWVLRLLQVPGLIVRTELRQVVYLEVGGDPAAFSPGRLPVWIEHPADMYGFPEDGVAQGIKIASHHAGHVFDPTRGERPVMEEALEEVRLYAMKRFPGLSGRVLSARSCLYTITPDERFILDHVSASGRLVVCSGCSGHGFKFTVLLGRIAADMAVGGLWTKPTGNDWALRRFLRSG